MKKVIIIILLMLIIASLGVIGYLVLKQNNIKLSDLIKTSPKQTITTTINNPFPVVPINQTQTVDNNPNTNNPSNLNTNNSSIDTTDYKTGLSQLSVANLSLLPINLSDIKNKTYQTVFIDREFGNLYSLDEQNNLTRRSNSTISGIGELLFGYDKNGWRFLIRQVKNGNTTNQLGQFNLATSTYLNEISLSNWPLSFEPQSIVLSPDSQNLAFLTKPIGGKTVLYTSDWSFKKLKKVWESDLSEWLISWPKDNLITITSKPAYDYLGVSYLLDLKTGQIKKIIDNINGLTVLMSPDGKKLIYNKSLMSDLNLYILNLGTKENSLLQINTLTEKCLWADNNKLYCAVPRSLPIAKYPDDWYQGKLSFSDDIWLIDLEKKTNSIVNQLKGNYDLNHLTINTNTNWLYAIDKDNQWLQSFPIK